MEVTLNSKFHEPFIHSSDVWLEDDEDIHVVGKFLS